MIVIDICRKKGWRINPDDALVNDIFRKLYKTNGHCPTKVENRKGHDQCPCSAYLQDGVCYCGLYIKEDNK
jgi:ferredoxin-thioredoxin reductase catalytic subunit